MSGLGNERMHCPDVRFDVDTFVCCHVHLDGVKAAWDDVWSAFGELQAGPSGPFLECAWYEHGAATGFDDPGAQAYVHTQPGIEGQAFVGQPGDVAVDVRERVLILLVWA